MIENILVYCWRASVTTCGISVDVPTMLAAIDDQSAVILDVRTPEEFAAGSVPQSVNIPIDELRTRLHELPQDQKIIAYCQVGMRGYLATRILKQYGFDVVNLSGGYKSSQMHHAT